MQGLGNSRFSARWKKGLVLGAVSLVAILALRWLAHPILGTQASLLFFTIPVLIAAYYGGLVPGLAATVVSGVLGVALFVVPNHVPGGDWRVEYLRVAVFLSQGGLVSVLTEELHRARSRAERAAEESRESDERFRLLMDATRDYALCGLDAEGRFNSWNAGAERMTGYAAEEVLGRPVGMVYAPEDREAGRPEEVLRVAAAEGVCRSAGRRVRRDGGEYWAEVTVTAIRDAGTGELRGYAAVSHDVTDRRAAEAAVRDHLARTRGILQAAADAILTFDAAGRIESANPSAERVFGHAAEALVGRDVRELLAISGGEGEMTAEGVRGRLEGGRETVGRRRDGSTFPAEVSVGDVELAGRRLCACFVKDITRRRGAEEGYRQLNERLEQRVAERTRQLEEVNEELRAFTYTVSHDLRSPLRGIQRFAQVLLSEDPEVTAERREEAARRTLASGARMERMIEDLLEYSRLTRQEVRPQRVSLILVVQEVLGQLERDPNYAKAQVVVREPLPIVLGQRAVLVRVLMNLLGNAIRHVGAGTRPWVRVWAEDREGLVRVWVEDNGVGIAAEDRERIFEPFGHAGAAGDDSGVSGGLGLAIVRKGVERMGGRLGLESEVGRGSRFWVELAKG